VSDGGTGAYYIAMRDTTPYASFLPLNGYVLVLRSPELATGDLFLNNLRNKPLFIVNGGRDPLYPIDVVEPSIVHMDRGGVAIVYRPQPQAGRLLRPGDETPKANGFVVLSDSLWRERFGGRADAVGKTMIVEGRPHAIVGVAMPGFHFPDHDAQIWTPYDDPTVSDASVQGGMWLAPTLGRLRPGVSLAQAEAEGTAVARSRKRPPVANMLFGTGGPVQVRVETVAGQMTSGVRPVLLMLAGSVAFLLLIACANVANLFLSRGVGRQRELAVRAAIGASRAQLAVQLLTESTVYACGGGALGLVFAWMLVRVTPLLAPADFPRLDAVRLDWTMGLFAVAAASVAALASGVLPAVRGARFDLASSLHPGDGAAGGGFSGAHARHLRSLLLAGESALAALLLIGAALLGRSFVSLTRVDPGYDANRVLTARVYPGERVVQFSEIPLLRLLLHFAAEDFRRVLPAWTNEFYDADDNAGGALVATLLAFSPQMIAWKILYGSLKRRIARRLLAQVRLSKVQAGALQSKRGRSTQPTADI
jgi:hypothetical protein